MSGFRPTEDDLILWARVVSAVSPRRGVKRPPPPAPPSVEIRTVAPPQGPALHRGNRPGPRAPLAIEPNRLRRIARGQERIEGRLDLHGLDQGAARGALIGFLSAAAANGWRTVMVITGKGRAGDGMLKRRTPEWLSEPPLRSLVAGYHPAGRRDGGEGALYVTLRARVHPPARLDFSASPERPSRAASSSAT